MSPDMETLELLRDRCHALIVAQCSQDPAEIEEAEEAIVATAMRVFGYKQEKERGEETMRNFEKAVAEGNEIVRQRPRMDLWSHELMTFLEQIENGKDIGKAIHEAYMAGVAVGHRNK